MPFKPAEVPKCPTCDKSVYAAEEKLAGGYKWHKICFKCCKYFYYICSKIQIHKSLHIVAMCNKMLDSTNCSEHDKTLFCKTCHARKFGPKGVGFGMGAGALNMDNGERQGNTEFVTNKPIDPNNYGFF